MLNVTKKLLDKSPIKYPLVRSARWLDPEQIMSDRASCEAALLTCLQVLVNAGLVNGRNCDKVISEYRKRIVGDEGRMREVNVNARAEGERGAREDGGGEFRELTEETLMVLHTGRGSTKNFAKRIVFHMIDSETMMNSNCHGRTHKTSKRPNVQAIDPRVLSYAIRKTVEEKKN